MVTRAPAPGGAAPTLSVSSGHAPDLQPPRGRLLSPRQVVALFFADLDPAPSEKWVRRTVPNKVRLSHNKVAFYEGDVRAWLEQRRGAA